MKIICLITILLICVGCSTEKPDINNQPHGTIIVDERGPELKQIENKLFKRGENCEKKENKAPQAQNPIGNGSCSQK
jgi:uncharacterized protein YcfL